MVLAESESPTDLGGACWDGNQQWDLKSGSSGLGIPAIPLKVLVALSGDPPAPPAVRSVPVD
jgi:hypothetical protein